MKTFTVRDVSRKTADVFALIDVEGSAQVVSRDGRTYEIRATPQEKASGANFDSIRKKLFGGKKVPRALLERAEEAQREER